MARWIAPLTWRPSRCSAAASSSSSLSSSPVALPADERLKPGDPVDYSKAAFYPKRWKENKHDLELVPWEGENITFLTLGDGHDPATMTSFVRSLDAGWALYAKHVGSTPRPHRLVNGKPPIAAVPNGMTCGYGCGFVGATGIEMTNFYNGHLPLMKKDPKAVPHAYFYEMGRNYFTFGKKHDCFTTGFAVFMRYVCMDSLELNDRDQGTRKVIFAAIEEYEQSDLPFLRTFTNADGLSEKQNRLKTSPTDQPVMYASAMLKLWKEHGDEWLGRFFRQLATCPEANAKTKEGAQQQSFHWLLAASCAAKKDLSPTFVDKWRLELTPPQKDALQAVDWTAKELNAGSNAPIERPFD